jgi:hypothetical protein
MTEYLIAFNDTWVPDHTVEELRAKAKVLKPLVAEMKAAGVLIFTGGLDDAAPVFSVDASSGTPLFTDGPFVESKDRPRLWLAAGGATLPGPHATSRDFLTESAGVPTTRLS